MEIHTMECVFLFIKNMIYFDKLNETLKKHLNNCGLASFIDESVRDMLLNYLKLLTLSQKNVFLLTIKRKILT